MERFINFSSSNARAVINEVNTEKMTPAAQFSSKLKQNPPVLSTVTNTTGSIEAKSSPFHLQIFRHAGR